MARKETPGEGLSQNNLVRGVVNPVTGGKAISAGGIDISAEVGMPQSAALVSPSTLQMNYADPAGVFGYTSATSALDKSVQRFSNYTRRVDISASTAQIRAGTRSITCNASDRMLSIDVYIPFLIVSGASGHAINVEISNETAIGANKRTFSFDASYLRQGWNSLRMWEGDTDGATGTGTLAYGATKSASGTSCDMGATIQSVYVTFNNMSGLSVYLDGVRRAAKVRPCLVMGFDATGTGTSDAVMTEKVAPLFATYGYAGYFTVTNIYDQLYAGGADDLRKRALYRDYGWDALVHTWNHGATVPGGQSTVTAAVVADLVTITKTAHGNAVGSKWHGSVSGATPAACNGVFEMTATTANAFTYTATGAGTGAVTGTITYSTLLADVVNVASTLSTQILQHEVADLVTMMKSVGFNRGVNIGAWPNNSSPELTTNQSVCSAAGVKLFRGSKGGSVKINEFGVDNPLHFGSWEMGNGTTATTLQFIKDKLTGVIGRGENMWTYGHYILDDTNPANSAYFPVDNNLAPGQGSNPAAPAGGTEGGGWWYYSTLARFLSEAVAPLVSSGALSVKRPSDWALSIGVK